MNEALNVHRLHFAFTITFHYIFPQLTMGLALLLVYLKTKALRTGDEHYNRAARFWARGFGINFALGVVTGIPDGVSVRNELGGLLENGRRRNWANARNGRRVFLFSRVELSWVISIRRKKARARWTLVGGVFSLAWLMALGIFNRSYGRVDATSRGVPHGGERRHRAGEFLGTAAEQVGALAIRSHHARRGANRLLRNDRGRRLLSPDTPS